MKCLIIFVATALLAFSSSEELPERRPVKRSYVCPPHFIRLSHRCYYFSKEATTWQNAHFKCRDLHSNLVIIKNANQDKHIKRTLGKNTLGQQERWVGGVYDWQQMAWKWASSGKPLTYKGFADPHIDDNKEALRYHCIVLDPTQQFMWNHKNCLEQKQYICHTKIKIVTNRGKKKLQKQYKTNKFNRLNEIPVPTIPEDLYNSNNNNTNLIKSLRTSYTFEINNDINAAAQYTPKPRKVKKNRRNKLRKTTNENDIDNSINRRRRKNKEIDKIADRPLSIDYIRYKTYKEATPHPLYPRPIVEEYNFPKNMPQ